MSFLRAKELIKISIWCHKSILNQFLEFLSGKSIMHVTKQEGGIKPSHYTKLLNDCLEAEGKLNHIIELLGPPIRGRELDLPPSLEEAVPSVCRRIEEIYDEVYNALENVKASGEMERKLESIRKELRLLREVRELFNEAGLTAPLYAFKAMALEVEPSKGSIVLNKLLEVSKGKIIAIKIKEERGTGTYLLVYPEFLHETVIEVVRGNKIGYKILSLIGLEEAIMRLEEEEGKLVRRAFRAKAELTKLKEEYGPELIALKEALELLKARVEIILGGSYFSSFYSISGWIPREELNEFLKNVEREFGDLVVVESIETLEKPPTLIEPPKILSPIQKLINAYGLPDYNEINPAIIAWLTFPLFFGIMFGDVGQGLVLLVFSLFSMFYIRKKVKNGNSIVNLISSNSELLLLSSIFSIIFGFVYGNFFGPERLGTGLVHPLEYPYGTNYMMIFSLTVGAFHIGTGLLLAVLNDYLAGDYGNLALRSLPRLIFYFVFSYPIVYKFFNPSWKLNLFSIYSNPYVLMALTSPLIIIVIGSKLYPRAGEGLLESFICVFETALESLSHTISYLRLWALSMAHEALMMAFISIASPMYVTSPPLA
ncbi:MAG: hypothetical protein B6U69_03470, partial [Thermofilum sp. ex4484_15]